MALTMTPTLIAIAAAYVVMGVLLLSVGLTSRFAWWVKAAVITITSVFFIEVFFASKGLLGWPATGASLPPKFQLLWSRVVEPDPKMGSKGAIYHTTNGGLTWDKQRTELETGDAYTMPGSEGAKLFDVSGICFVDADHGYAAARAREEEETGRVIGTANGGATWTRQGRITDSGVHDLFFVSANEGWILTDKGSYILHTTDGNKSWLSEKKELDFDPPVSRVGAADAQHVWAVGGGMIIVSQSN